MDPACRWLLVDDHQLFLESFRLLLRAMEPAADIRTASDSPSVLSAQSDWTPQLVVLDWHLPGVSAAALTADWASAVPPIPVLVVSGTTEIADVAAAMDAGAAGFVSKADDPQLIQAALMAVLGGQSWLSTERAHAVAAYRRKRQAPPLSSRQQQIVRLLAEGHSNQQIAETLGLKSATVKTHIAGIFSVLGANNRAEAVYRARAAGHLQGSI